MCYDPTNALLSLALYANALIVICWLAYNIGYRGFWNFVLSGKG